MLNQDILRRDDPYGNLQLAANNTRIAIEKIARSQAWDIEGAVPFPADILPLLQEASKLLTRAQAQARSHALTHVWPVRDALGKAYRQSQHSTGEAHG